MFKILSKIFGNKTAQKLFELLFIFKTITLLLINYKRHSRSKSEGTILLGLIPTHQNLGDYALYLSALQFIKDFYPNHTILELTILEMPNKIFEFRNSMNSNTDLVFLIGGGNMGSRYLIEEFNRQVIFYVFRDFKRIQLPQSSSYENNLKGKLILKISQLIFQLNKDKILITSRDEKSFHFFKSKFNTKVLFFPDTVLYLKFSNNSPRTEKVLYCIRDDEESKFNSQERKKIKKIIHDKFSCVENFDTINKDTNCSNEVAFDKLINNISTSKLVITDRLHGVIFAFITNTNVIALPTCDHKLIDFFNWIKDFETTNFVSNITELENLLNRIQFANFKNSNVFESNFKQLKNEIDIL